MSVAVKRAGRYVELEFTGAEIIDVHGNPNELYGDGTITMTRKEAIELAKELLDAVLDEEEEVKEETA